MAINDSRSDPDRLDRQRNFVEAKASVRLEGGNPSPELEALGQLYVDGILDIDEFVEQGLAIAEAIHREN